MPLNSISAVQGHILCAIRDSNPEPAVKEVTIPVDPPESTTRQLTRLFGESRDHQCAGESTRVRLKVMSKR